MLGNAENGELWWGSVLRKLAWGGAAFLWLLPLAAMQFTKVNWDLFDFIVAGALLFGSAGIVDLATRTAKNLPQLIAAVIAVGASFLVIWVNLAVGIIGSEDHPANLMFFGVIAIAMAGTFVARFRPEGMAWTMAVTALAQLSIPMIALLVWTPPITWGLIKTLAFNGIFAAMWLLSASLFRKAAREQRSAAAAP